MITDSAAPNWLIGRRAASSKSAANRFAGISRPQAASSGARFEAGSYWSAIQGCCGFCGGVSPSAYGSRKISVLPPAATHWSIANTVLSGRSLGWITTSRSYSPPGISSTSGATWETS